MNKTVCILLCAGAIIHTMAQGIDWQLYEQKRTLLTARWIQPPQNMVNTKRMRQDRFSETAG